MGYLVKDMHKSAKDSFGVILAVLGFPSVMSVLQLPELTSARHMQYHTPVVQEVRCRRGSHNFER